MLEGGYPIIVYILTHKLFLIVHFYKPYKNNQDFTLLKNNKQIVASVWNYKILMLKNWSATIVFYRPNLDMFSVHDIV